MSGFGMRLHWESRKALGDIKLWREESFLHQLSLNGSLLLAENHDRLWLSLLASTMSTMRSPWDVQVELLRILPAHMTRQILWHTSRQWYYLQSHSRYRLAKWQLESGVSTPPALEGLDKMLVLRAKQLDLLQWCSEDTTAGRIDVVEEGIDTPHEKQTKV
jgi:hypothetical protein